ncbi:zeta toxin family protein [Paeniglutamicibacter sp. NPDC091659]|uniref:zeta toxin family protein n=1 Tax=Paeniglutamicibacter sp. NPDC091659 TaxID=3364389 RepID=UPI0037F29343
MSPVDISEHRESIRILARDGGPLSPSSPNATMNNPQWFFGGQQPRAVRGRMHDELLEEYRSRFPEVRSERRALVLAGPPGAGKTTALKTDASHHAAHWLKIDADEFKVLLLSRALEDGSYEGFIKPQAVKDLEAQGDRFNPLELASLVHAESSYLAEALREMAIEDGLNVVIDSVLSKPEKAVELGAQLAAAGYTVDVLHVEVPFELSAAQIEKRWQEAHKESKLDPNSLGGRWVPSEYARDVFDGKNGRSKSQESAIALANQCDSVVSFRRFYRASEDAKPVLEVHMKRAEPGAPLVDAQVHQASRVAGMMIPSKPALGRFRDASGPSRDSGFGR